MTRRVFVKSFPAALLAGAPTNLPVPFANVVVEEVSLTRVELDHVTLRLRSHIVASRKVKLKSIQFEAMKLNGMPFSLDGVSEKLTLIAGQSVAMPPLFATVFFRDVSSLKPLEQAIRNETVYVTGKCRVELEMNFAEKLFSGYFSGTAQTEIAGELPIFIPGGAAGRLAALATLTAAETLFGLADSVLGR